MPKKKKKTQQTAKKAKANEIQISKDKFRDLISKALGKSGSGKPILSEALFHFTDKYILFGEMIGVVAGNIGSINADYFTNYKIGKNMEVLFQEEHLNKMKYIRSSNVVMEIKKDEILFLSPDGKEKYPVGMKTRVYAEDDLTVEDIHDDVMPIEIKFGDRTVEFIDLESSYDRAQLTEEDEDYDDADDGYFEIYAYLRLPKKELLGLPPSDSIIFKKAMKIEKGQKAVEAIELRTLVKLDQKGGYNRLLTGDFLKFHDTTAFELRVDRSHLDKVVELLSDPIHAVFSQSYIMLSSKADNHWFSYLVGFSTLETETTSVEEETGDLKEALEEVKAQSEEEE